MNQIKKYSLVIIIFKIIKINNGCNKHINIKKIIYFYLLELIIYILIKFFTFILDKYSIFGV